jgi:hypothetical protein
MNRFLLSIAALSVVSGGAAPAMPQARSSGFDNKIANLEQQFERGSQRGTISRKEAQPLRAQLRNLKQLERQYSRGAFSKAEQRTLQQRIQKLQRQIQAAASNRR